ncbi:MAG TPA: DNA translocase FtsK [Bacillota bacterium]|nr:DNA translocase FtsK [Bacillota bacterium]
MKSLKDVFRKLADFLGLDRTTELPSEEDTSGDSDREIKPDIQVRTKVIYPQNRQNQGSSHFRFPIIPDEVQKEAKPKNDPQITVKLEPISRKPDIPANPIQNNNDSKVTKKPFKPTEIVSPVFGRKDPRLTPEYRYEGRASKVSNDSKESFREARRSDTAAAPTVKNDKIVDELLNNTPEDLDKLKSALGSQEDIVQNSQVISDGDNLEKPSASSIANQLLPSLSLSSEGLEDDIGGLNSNKIVIPEISQMNNKEINDKMENKEFRFSNLDDQRFQNQHSLNVVLTVEPMNNHQVLLDEESKPFGLKSRQEANIFIIPDTEDYINQPDLDRTTVLEENRSRQAEDIEVNSVLSNEVPSSLKLSTHDAKAIQSIDSIETTNQHKIYEQPASGLDVGVKQEQFSPISPRKSEGYTTASSIATGNYIFPDLGYLQEEPRLSYVDDHYTDQQIEKLIVTLENFSVKADVIGVVKGPTVTRYELQPAPGVKVNKFTNLIDDIKLALAAKDIRMEAPIPGRSAIGVEVPNEVSLPVFIRSILQSEEFIQNKSPLAIALGRDISGNPVIGDLKKMPHGLIAGSTGSGKSVCVNSIIISLLYKAKPEDVRLILIDPKVVELAPYNHIPHLLTPVVTDPKQATAALKWAVEEMDGRYEKFADTGARDIERYNLIVQREGKEKLPYIVIIIDELADLMMVSPHDVEESICRIAQKARACGIHLLLATQRPSVDVITGLIKANIPTRIAFAVSSQVDSRTILDMSGAERLLGKGDMLYYPVGEAKPTRLQGNFVSDDEIELVVDHIKAQQKTVYLFDKEELSKATSNPMENDDELFEEALLFVVEQGQASSSSLQRRFRIGYNRAARLVDMMEAEGFISAQSGSKPREVLLKMDEYRNLFG